MKKPLLLFFVLFLFACSVKTEPTEIANPASEFCVKQNGTVEIITAEDGSQSGNCKLVDGTICDEWAFYRGECPSKCPKECPQLAMIGPTFCTDGVVVSRGKDECNCTLPPECKKTEKTKFLVEFPWQSGESWTLTTDFHDENCLDFVNFDTKNDEVVAAADGEVLISNFEFPDSFNTYGPVETNNPEDMGNFVILKHGPGIYTTYFHLLHESTPPVKPGDVVKAGKRIGYEGNTGWSHGKHLHFCVVDVSIFPTPRFITKPLDSWGFKQADGTNKLVLNYKYTKE